MGSACLRGAGRPARRNDLERCSSRELPRTARGLHGQTAAIVVEDRACHDLTGRAGRICSCTPRQGDHPLGHPGRDLRFRTHLSVSRHQAKRPLRRLFSKSKAVPHRMRIRRGGGSLQARSHGDITRRHRRRRGRRSGAARAKRVSQLGRREWRACTARLDRALPVATARHVICVTLRETVTTGAGSRLSLRQSRGANEVVQYASTCVTRPAGSDT